MKKFGLVLFASQPQATFNTFSESLFREEVEEPIRALLATGVLQKILVVVMGGDSGEGEIFLNEYLPGEGLTAHAVSPTSSAVTHLLHDECEKGRVDVINIAHNSLQSAMQYAIAFVKTQSVECVMLKFKQASFPSEKDIHMFRGLMEGTRCEHLIFGAEFAPQMLFQHYVVPRELHQINGRRCKPSAFLIYRT